MRLLCDEMLGPLARWLRAAGYDTAVADAGSADRALIDRCAAEGRALISRDRRLVETAAERIRALHLTGNDLDDHAHTLARTLGIDWRHAPFSRCLIDNSPLRPADEEELARVPAPSRGQAGDVRACPACDRVYWPGGHVRRMSDRLQRWRAGA